MILWTKISYSISPPFPPSTPFFLSSNIDTNILHCIEEPDAWLPNVFEIGLGSSFGDRRVVLFKDRPLVALWALWVVGFSPTDAAD